MTAGVYTTFVMLMNTWSVMLTVVSDADRAGAQSTSS